jgi:hypothetical protein
MNEYNNPFYPLDMMFEFIHRPKHLTNRDDFYVLDFWERIINLCMQINYVFHKIGIANYFKSLYDYLKPILHKFPPLLRNV